MPVFISLWAFASRNMRVSLLRVFACMLVCLCVCPGRLVMHACHPLHASLCTTELHMTSIWEQWDSDLITNSLLLIKTCRLHPPPSPFLFFSALSPASLSFTRLSPSSPASSTPLLQSRTILRFLRCSLPKRAPFRALQKVISSPFFSFSVFIHRFFVLSSLLYIFRPSLSDASSSYRPAGLIETLLLFLIFSLSQSALTLIDTEQEKGWGWRWGWGWGYETAVSESVRLCVCINMWTHVLISASQIYSQKYTNASFTLSQTLYTPLLFAHFTDTETQTGLTFHLAPRQHCWEVWH